MKIFIDFDDVIFNTKEFGADLKIFYDRNDITQEMVQKYYYAAEDCGGIKLFDPEEMFARLEKYEKMNASMLSKDFAKYIKNLSKFVFSDVSDFLEFAGKENVYLISFGLPTFQNEKIVACGVDKLVTGCVVTKGSKAAAIAQVMEKMKIDPNEKIIFIDDRVQQVQDIKKAFSATQTFLLCRKEGRYCDAKNEYCDYEIHNLKEAQEIISNWK
jgi:FMN phosphatase YigB (HAD superfamily)